MDRKDGWFDDDYEDFAGDEQIDDDFSERYDPDPDKDFSLESEEELISPYGEEEENYDEPLKEEGENNAFFSEGSRMERRGQRRGSGGRFFKNLLLILAVLALIGASAYVVATRVDFSQVKELFTQAKKEEPKKTETEAKKVVKKEVPKKEAEKKETKTATANTEAKKPVVPPKIRVLNGNGLAGEADRIAEILRSNGAEIIDSKNADKHTYDKTLVASKPEFSDTAKELAAKLGNEYAAEISTTLPESDSADIQVILGAPSLKVGDYKTAVLNGNGIKGEAAIIANHLKSKGWQIVRQENADNAGYAKTLIKHKPDLAALAKVAQKEISSRYPAELRAELSADSPEDIQIVLGKDKK